MINAISAITPCTIRTILYGCESCSLETKLCSVTSIAIWRVQTASDETAVRIDSLRSSRHICVVNNKAVFYTIAFHLTSAMPIHLISRPASIALLTTILQNHKKITIDTDCTSFTMSSAMRSMSQCTVFTYHYMMFSYLGHRLYTPIMTLFNDNLCLMTYVVVVMAVSLPVASKPTTGDDGAVLDDWI